MVPSDVNLTNYFAALESLGTTSTPTVSLPTSSPGSSFVWFIYVIIAVASALVGAVILLGSITICFGSGVLIKKKYV